MKIQEKHFSHFITLSLLVLGAAYHSAPMAYASVAALALILGKDTYDRISVAKETKNDGTDELKRVINQLNTRVATIEHGISVRGF